MEKNRRQFMILFSFLSSLLSATAVSLQCFSLILIQLQQQQRRLETLKVQAIQERNTTLQDIAMLVKGSIFFSSAFHTALTIFDPFY